MYAAQPQQAMQGAVQLADMGGAAAQPVQQMQCGACQQVFGITPGAAQFQCPFCQTVNAAPPPQGVPMGAPMGYGAPEQQMMGAPMQQQQMWGGPPQQQMMAAPGQLMQVDPFMMLSSLQQVKIEEKMNMMETAAGLLGELMGVDMELEMANKYVVQTMQGHNLFFAVDQTDFCNRQCGGDCRGIDVDVVVLGQDPKVTQAAENQFDWSFNPFGKVDLSNSQKFFRMHKDCQCTCCCFNRPIIEVVSSVTDQTLGKIKDPWACCDMTFELMDANDEPTLTAKGGCCQLGLICPCPCGPCREVKFTVNDAKSGEEVASLKKIVPDCLKFIVADDVDNYEIEFGNIQNPEWKAMIIALSLFIDFRYFNVRSDKNDSASEGLFDGFSGEQE